MSRRHGLFAGNNAQPAIRGVRVAAVAAVAEGGPATVQAESARTAAESRRRGGVMRRILPAPP